MRLVFLAVLMVVTAFAASTTSFAESSTISSSSIISKTWWNNTPDTLAWTYITSMPTAVGRCAGAYTGNKYYNVMGSTGTGYVNKCQIWNGTSWTTSTATNPLGGFGDHSAAVVNGKIVVSGGYSNLGYHNTTTVYNPSNETWVLSTPCIRSDVVHPLYVGLGTKCYWFGGTVSGTSIYNYVYTWTPGDSSMAYLGHLPAARSYLMGAAYNDKIFLFGGSSTIDYYQGTKTIWQYTPSTNSWVTKSATLANNRCYGNAVTVGNKIYVIAGYTSSGISNAVEVYDPIADTITNGPSLPVATQGSGAGGAMNPSSNHSYPGTIIVAGGWGGSAYLGTACKGTVSVTYAEVAPASLGSIKAAYR